MFGRIFGRKRTGQTSPEYMMVIAVVTIAIVGAAYVFVPSFRSGTEALGTEVADILGTGNARGSNASGGNAGSGAATQGANPGGSANPNAVPGSGTPGLGQPAGSGSGSGSGSGTVATSGSSRDTRHTRTRGGFCLFGMCIGETRETAVGGGTGGDGELAAAQAIKEGQDLDNIRGAWKSFFQEQVALAAQAAGEHLQENPLCGPAIIAALTNRNINEVYRELEANGRLALVKQETIVAGVVVNTKYTTTGVMRSSQLAEALKRDYGIGARQHENANLGTVRDSLSRGNTPVVLYDNGDGSGRNGHFGIVSDVNESLGVKVDTATGSFWIPQDEFQRRMDAMGGKVISVAPPQGRPVASR